jgi:hypothetical protein
VGAATHIWTPLPANRTIDTITVPHASEYGAMRDVIATMVHSAQSEMAGYVKPRDDFERAVIGALGEISWDEAMTAILNHRAELPQPDKHEA